MRARRGFSLVEVVVATFIFAVGGLALAASAAAVSRQISINNLRLRAVHTARSRAERAAGLRCEAIAGGEETTRGIMSVWTAEGAYPLILRQEIQRTDSRGTHVDRFIAAVQCD